jgi:hypothetical protein
LAFHLEELSPLHMILHFQQLLSAKAPLPSAAHFYVYSCSYITPRVVIPPHYSDTAFRDSSMARQAQAFRGRKDGCDGGEKGGKGKVPVAFYSIIIIFHPTPHYGCWQRDFTSSLSLSHPSLSLSHLIAVRCCSAFPFLFPFLFFFWHKHT